MLRFALNHMSVPQLTTQQAAAVVRDLKMAGLELRNDLERPLFDGQQPAPIADAAIFALAEVKAFNAFDDDVADAAVALMDQAVSCGAQAIVLIPQVGGAPVPADGLRTAMVELGPELARRGLLGLIEPIGFQNSTLRFKSDVVTLLDALNVGGQFKLIHDTFHHFVAGEAAFFPDHTHIVHISGVSEGGVTAERMTDAHRGLVDADDRLGNTDQITELLRGGFNGPFSFEAFSPEVHADIDPEAALSRSIHFIENEVLAYAA